MLWDNLWCIKSYGNKRFWKWIPLLFVINIHQNNWASSPSLLKLLTMLADGAALRSLVNRSYSSSMYSGGSVRGLGRGPWSVQFNTCRNWPRTSCMSTSSTTPGAERTRDGSRTQRLRTQTHPETGMTALGDVMMWSIRMMWGSGTPAQVRPSLFGLTARCGARGKTASSLWISWWSVEGRTTLSTRLCWQVWRCCHFHSVSGFFTLPVSSFHACLSQTSSSNLCACYIHIYTEQTLQSYL